MLFNTEFSFNCVSIFNPKRVSNFYNCLSLFIHKMYLMAYIHHCDHTAALPMYCDKKQCLLLPSLSLHWHYRPCCTLCRIKIHGPEIFVSPEPEVMCGTVAIIIRVVLLSPFLRIRGVSLSSFHYNQSHRVYINRRQEYICLI